MKKIIVIGVIGLLIFVGFQPAFANDLSISMLDDTTPPVTWHELNPPEPNGENGWYINVEVWICAEDLESGVKGIKISLNNGPWQTLQGYPCTTFLFTEQGNDIFIRYTATDNAGNQAPIKSFTIKLDSTDPTIDITYDVVCGNPLIGWYLLFTATATDSNSGMDRVEFFLNDGLQDTVYGSGPEYQWGFRYYGDLSLDIIADAYDRAGNMASDIVVRKDKATNIVLLCILLERFPLLQRLFDIWRLNLE